MRDGEAVRATRGGAMRRAWRWVRDRVRRRRRQRTPFNGWGKAPSEILPDAEDDYVLTPQPEAGPTDPGTALYEQQRALDEEFRRRL